MKPIQIYPSILAADFSSLGQEIRTVERAGADGIHFDVMDGHFVPNISFGPVVLSAIRKTTRLPFWVHLMITDPQKYASDFIEAGADGLFIHPEINLDIVTLAKDIQRKGIKPGMAINPETQIEQIKNIIPDFQDFLVMTVHPGFGGQELIPEILNKIGKIRELAKESGSKAVIHVDGGVNFDTVRDVVLAGTDVLVAGSCIFKQPDIEDALKTLRKKAIASCKAPI